MSRGKFSKKRRGDRIRAKSAREQEPVVVQKKWKAPPFVEKKYEPLNVRKYVPDEVPIASLDFSQVETRILSRLEEGAEFEAYMQLVDADVISRMAHLTPNERAAIKQAALLEAYSEHGDLGSAYKRALDAQEKADRLKTQVAPAFNKGAPTLIVSAEQAKWIGRK